MTTEEIKQLESILPACPFCGEPMRFDEIARMVFVECVSGRCPVHIVSIDFEDAYQQAAEAWIKAHAEMVEMDKSDMITDKIYVVETEYQEPLLDTAAYSEHKAKQLFNTYYDSEVGNGSCIAEYERKRYVTGFRSERQESG